MKVRLQFLKVYLYILFSQQIKNYKEQSVKSVRMRENTDQSNSECGHFSSSESLSSRMTQGRTLLEPKLNLPLLRLHSMKINHTIRT